MLNVDREVEAFTRLIASRNTTTPLSVGAIDFFEVDKDITLRRMVLRNSNQKGTVLFLHGFPETLYAWKDIAKALADDYEVHAFDFVNATRATFSANRRFDRGRGKVVGADLVRRTRHDLHGSQNAGRNQAPYHVVRDTQSVRGLAHGEPFAAFPLSDMRELRARVELTARSRERVPWSR